MHKILKMLKNNNCGNTFVVVVVTVSFLMIISAALISTVATVYYSKLYDYNARDNFHFVEQAMDEIYESVGAKVNEAMIASYNDVLTGLVNNIDLATGEYTSLDNDVANKNFKDTFMMNVFKGDFFKTTELEENLQRQITNDCYIVPGRLDLKVYKRVGDDDVLASEADRNDPDVVISKVAITNVTVERKATYRIGRRPSEELYKQTIQTDIVISRPSFNVSFEDATYPINNLFDYCIIADSGVEVNEDYGNTLSLNGNVYAASDFYNKKYNNYDGASDYSGDKLSYVSGKKKYEYTFRKVSSYTPSTLENVNSALAYDGDNDRSKYSGFYVSHNKVSVMAENFIVPGTIAIMDGSDLSVYGGSTGKNYADVWTDNVFLGGSNIGSSGSRALFNANMYIKDDLSLDASNTSVKLVGNYYGYSNGSLADSRYFVPTVKTDANGKNIYTEAKRRDDGSVVYENRGHYNSSAIVVNGEKASIDLSNAGNIYLAGRSYIELSRMTQKQTSFKNQVDVTKTDDPSDKETKDEDGVVETYQYDAATKDYKTGESLSLANAQFAYKPYDESVIAYDADGNVIASDEAEAHPENVAHYESRLPQTLQDKKLFLKYFGRNKALIETVPVTYKKETVRVVVGQNADHTDKYEDQEKVFVYLDFKYAAEHDLYDEDKFSNPDGSMKLEDVLSSSFIKDYYYYLIGKFDEDATYVEADGTLTWYKDNKKNTTTVTGVDADIMSDDIAQGVLKSITTDENFTSGSIKLPETGGTSRSSIYSSGTVALANALVSTEESKAKTFNVISKKETSGISKELKTIDAAGYKGLYSSSTSTPSDILVADAFSKGLASHANYVKWALTDLDKTSADAAFVDKIVKAEGRYSDYGEGSITPINNYMNYDLLDGVDIHPYGTGAFDLGDYRVWINDGTTPIEVTCKDASDNNEITGIVITKGDVYFNNYTGEDAYKTVKKFNGIVIAGGKVYINGDVREITSSFLCKKIMETCIGLKRDPDPNVVAKAKTVLKVFKAYEPAAEADVATNENVNINAIDYTTVLGYEHWMRNVSNSSN